MHLTPVIQPGAVAPVHFFIWIRRAQELKKARSCRGGVVLGFGSLAARETAARQNADRCVLAARRPHLKQKPQHRVEIGAGV